MSFQKEDGVSSLCQKALHIVTELCFAGQVEWEKCSSIFPTDRGSQGGSSTGNWGRAPLATSQSSGTCVLSALSSRVLSLQCGAGASLGRRAFLSYLAPSFWSAPSDFQRGLFGFCLLASICPASSTSLVHSIPAGAVSRSQAPAPPLSVLSHASDLPPGVEGRARAASDH